MSKKIALVFDTNFIFEHTADLIAVVESLKADHNVYVTQISIEERLGQKRLDIEKRYEDLETASVKFKDIAKVIKVMSLEKCIEKDRKLSINAYDKLFGERIIPFEFDDKTFSAVLDRALLKRPPFTAAENASDKGFKDTLIWFSLLKYFSASEEEEVIFLTNDNGFRKNMDKLCKEFQDHTGKKIYIKENNYYNTHDQEKESEGISEEIAYPLQDINQLREKVKATIYALCVVESESDYGDPEWQITFSLRQKVDCGYIEEIFKKLEPLIRAHLFESTISANEAFELDNRVTNILPIQITALENALLLFKDIKQKLPDYLPQFYNAVAMLFNNNYRELQEVDDDELPF